jgi:hypothetical protein
MGSSRSPRDSQIMAFLNFFEEADRVEINSRSIRDPAAFSLRNVKGFWDWYRLEHPGTSFAMDGPLYVEESGLLKAQLLMNRYPLGEAMESFAEAGEPHKMELLAYLTGRHCVAEE